MQVVNVSVRVRESKESGQGWRSLELAADAQVYPTEDWKEAQQALYGALKEQLETLGSGTPESGNGHFTDNGSNGHGAVEETVTVEAERPAGRTLGTQVAEATAGDAVCPTHHKAKQGKYGLYCPTKMADGSWCTWRSKD